MRTIYMWDKKLKKVVETTPSRVRNLRTASVEEMTRRDSCYVMDDLRQDYQRISDEAERAHNKGVQEQIERRRLRR